jgi:hypothetical protein
MSAYIFSPSFCEAVDSAADFGVDVGFVAGFQRVFQIVDRAFDLFFLAGFQLVAVFGQRFAGRMHQRVALVARSASSFSFLSSSALASASFTIFWISASVRPELP